MGMDISNGSAIGTKMSGHYGKGGRPSGVGGLREVSL